MNLNVRPKPLFILIFLLISMSAQQSFSQEVYVNGVSLEDNVINALEQYYRIKVQPGRYWYDPVCGAWGVEGGGVQGIMAPNLQIGGNLSPDASNGTSGVYLNGRQLTIKEQQDLGALVGQPVLPGRYWVDAWGNAGYVGQPATVNLYQLAKRQQSTFHRGKYTDISSGGQGDTFYVIDKDFSYISGY